MAPRPRRRRHEGRPIEGRPNAKTFRVRKRYLQFDSALSSLNHHFDNWLLPREPEESEMTRVILALQNILEYETELAIAVVASRSSNPRDRKLQSRIEEGYASFKEKFKWLRDKGLISEADENVMEK
jgi:agmatine/peptidylarginine deiminase